MKKFKRFGLLLVVVLGFVLTTACFAGCGDKKVTLEAPKNYTLVCDTASKEMNYSFDHVEGVSYYIITLFKKNLDTGAIDTTPTAASSRINPSDVNADGKMQGSFTMSAANYGEYEAKLIPYCDKDSEYIAPTEFPMIPIKYGGAIGMQSVEVKSTGAEMTVSINYNRNDRTVDGLSKTYWFEMITSYTFFVYSDESCETLVTQKTLDGKTMEFNTNVPGPPGAVEIKGNSISFDMASYGAKKYYIRMQANGFSDYVTASPLSQAKEHEIKF